ncbi:MAG: hypothetical protein V3R72_10100 [Gammaproteobacteria bacterium]
MQGHRSPLPNDAGNSQGTVQPAKRELLHELDVARQALMRVTPKAEVTENIDRVYANLVRMWAEP